MIGLGHDDFPHGRDDWEIQGMRAGGGWSKVGRVAGVGPKINQLISEIARVPLSTPVRDILELKCRVSMQTA